MPSATPSNPTADTDPAASASAVIYLLHFDKPFKHARHYCGWTQNLDARLKSHQAGAGARLLQVITQAGISWTLARTWPGDRNRERQLKRQGGASRRCPICRAQRDTPSGT
jgi:predicted GIY-YIG superfamily endonuclease